VRFVLGDEGQGILREFGFNPARADGRSTDPER
jgi:hypothetical protein